MNRLLIIFYILINCLNFAYANNDQQQAAATIEFRDSAGDVEAGHYSDPRTKPVDVVKVDVRSNGKELQSTIHLDKDMNYYFTDTAGEAVLSLFVDVDKNEETGGRAKSCEKEAFDYVQGFEYEITVFPCLDYGGGKNQCLGAPRKDKVVGYLTSWEVKKFSDSRYVSLEPNRNQRSLQQTKWKGTPIKGNQMEVSLPYTDLGLKSGMTVGISAYEEYGKDENACFPVKFLKIQ
jgi:hypothetical protein